MLYLRLIEERLERDSSSPTGQVRRMIPSDKCAVFDETQLDNLIGYVRQHLRALVKLKTAATTHSLLVKEESLKALGVPFKVRRFVQKRG